MKLEAVKEIIYMNIELRKLQDSDKVAYIKLENEVWVNKKMLQDEEHNDRLWKSMFSDTEIYYAVLMENQVCGFASILKLDKEVQELGLELFEKCRHKGIGYVALVQLLEICKKEYKIKNIQSKVYADNFPSILLMRKIGGTPYGITRNACIEEASQLEYQKENKGLISDNVKKVAKIFNVEPELLLSHLLIFKIPIEPVESQFHVSFTGNLNYEKRIETQALNYLYLETERSLRSILEKIENNPSENGVNEEIEDMIKRLETGI